MTIVSFPPQTFVEYPESDGKPMAETIKHLWVITYLIDVLTAWFHERVDMYVGGNNLIYYAEGFPKDSFAPDVYLIPGLDKTPRRVLKLWEIKRAPAVIFEITSRSTWETDLGDKMELYAQLGVREYFVYDVEHEELDPPLRGFRLVGKTFEALRANEDGEIYSQEIQLALQEIDGTLRLVNPNTREILRNYVESEAAARTAEEQAREAEEQAEREHLARLAAEAEAARLRAELEALRGKQT